MPNRLFLLDVDDTLFDTVRYKKEIAIKLEKLFPNSNIADKFWATAQRFRGGKYYWHEVIQAFCTEQNCIDQHDVVFDTMLSHDFSSLLFPEVLTSLEKLKAFGTLAIFSTGDNLLQQVKVQQSGLTKIVTYVFIFDDKTQHLQEVMGKFPDYEYWFIDNHLDILETAQKTIPTLHTGHMIRGETPHASSFSPELSLHNLDDLLAHFTTI